MGLSASGRWRSGAHRVTWLVAAVFLLALLARLEYLRELSGSGLWDYLRLDPLYYHDWAVRIARGDATDARTYEMTPLYAYALGGLFKLAGYSLLIPRLIQAAIGAGTCAAIALLGCRVFGTLEGALGGIALALYGPALFHDAQIMKTVLTVALSTVAAAAIHFSEGTRVRWLFAGGALVGLTALCQENINITLPFLLAWIAWRGRGAGWRRCLGRGAALLAGFGLLVAPATLRNYAVSGDIVLITSGGGEVFYTGNNEQASGKYQPPAFVRPDPFLEHEDFRAEAARRLGHPVTRRQSDAFWWGEGWRFIVGHPAAYAALLADKVSTYFNAFERPDNYSYYNFARFVPMLNLPLPGFGLVAPLGLIGIALSARRWESLLPLYAVIGCYILSGLLFFTQDRYRMPMIPLMTLFAACAVTGLARAARSRRVWTLAWCVPALAAVALFVNRDPGNSESFDIQNDGILGEMLLYAGRGAEAETLFSGVLGRLGPAMPQASVPERRMRASAHYGIALARGDAATDDDTLSHLRAAGDAPDADLRRDALDRLGASLMSRGDPSGAAAAYRTALEADTSAGPGTFARRLRLAEALHAAGQPAEALRAVQEALGGAPAGLDPVLRADAHYGAALIYLREIPDRDQAAAHLREVLRLNPGHPRAGWIRQTLAALGPAMEGR